MHCLIKNVPTIDTPHQKEYFTGKEWQRSEQALLNKLLEYAQTLDHLYERLRSAPVDIQMAAEGEAALGNALTKMLTEMFADDGAPVRCLLRFIDASTYRNVKFPLQMLQIPNSLIVKARKIIDAINQKNPKT